MYFTVYFAITRSFQHYDQLRKRILFFLGIYFFTFVYYTLV